jgi:hypothetical protein
MAAALSLTACGDRSKELLPDLDQVAPSAISVKRVNDRDLLVFLSSVENVGRGPLVVAGTRTNAGDEMTARQLVRRADGSTTEYRLRSVLRFVASETHRHWHLLGFERYELRAAGGRTVARDRKTGFCLGDRYDRAASERLPGEPAQAVWTQECGRNDAGRRRITEGISPGYGDDYVPLLEGQSLDVTELPPGRYVLVHRVNADRDLRESDYENDAASALIELARGREGGVSVHVVRRCADTAACS